MKRQENNVNAVDMANPAEDDQANEPPIRWARPSPRILRKQATRITIIEVPTEIHSDDDDEKAGDRENGKRTSTMSKSCRRLWMRCRYRWMDNFGIFKLDYIQRKFLLQGVFVRAVLMAHAFFIFYVATVTVHSGIYAAVCLLYFVGSVTEALVMYKLRGFSQKKWICTSTFLYTVCVIPAIWSLHVILLKERERESEDYEECVRTFDSCWGGFGGDLNITLLSTNKRAFAPNSYADFALTTAVCQYTMVFALIFCRWLLPRDNFTREKVAQLLLVLVGSGEDIVEFIGVVFTIGHFGCSRAITGTVLLLWSLSVFQFSIAIPERSVTRVQDKPSNALLNVWVDAVNQLLIKRRQTVGDVSLYVAKDPTCQQTARGKSRIADKLKSKLPKRRATVTVQNVPVRRYDWFRSNEFREAIISITIQDGPFLIFRLVVIAILGNIAISIVFYALKNLTVILVQIYRMYAMLVEFKIRRRSSLLPVRIEEDSDVETANEQDDDKSEAASVMCDKAFAYTVPQSLTGSRAHLPNPSTPDLTAVTSTADQDNNNTPLGLTSASVLDLRTRRQSKANDDA